MITLEQFANAGITISDELVGNAALEWIGNNTTLIVNTDDVTTVNALPFSAKLFVVRYSDIMGITGGVTSESAQGLSQSYDTSGKMALIWQYAQELLGGWLKPSVGFVTAMDRWK